MLSPTQNLSIPANAFLLHSSHSVMRPIAPFRPFIGRFYAEQEALATKIASSPSQQPTLFSGSRMYFVPGFMNHIPHQGFLRHLSGAAEHELAFVSVSEQANYFENSGYTVIGGESSVYNPDWRQELATVMSRLYVDIKEQEVHGRNVERPILMGHSKGGLLLHSLAAFVKAEKFGEMETLFKVFPAVKNLPKNVVSDVLQFLQGAYYLGIAAPFDGLDERTLAIAKKIGFDKLFHNTPYYFSKDFLEEYYKQTNLQPEDPEHGIHAVITAQPFRDEAHSVCEIAFRTLYQIFTSSGSVVFHAGNSMFDLGAKFLGSHTNHDALVAESKREFRHNLHVRGSNHVSIMDASMAPRVLEFIHDTRP